MAAYGTHNLEIPDGTDRASVPVAFTQYTDTLDTVLETVSTQASNAAIAAGNVNTSYGALSGTVTGHTTQISTLTTKTNNLAKAGTMLVVRLTADFAVNTDSTYITIPFNTVEYRHTAGAYSAGVWTAPIAGRVKVTAGALVAYGSTPGNIDRTGTPSILTVQRSGSPATSYRIAQVPLTHPYWTLNGSTVFSVAANQTVWTAVYMNSSGVNKTVRGQSADGNPSFMTIEYLQDSTPV